MLWSNMVVSKYVCDCCRLLETISKYVPTNQDILSSDSAMEHHPLNSMFVQDLLIHCVEIVEPAMVNYQRKKGDCARLCPIVSSGGFQVQDGAPKIAFSCLITG